MSDIDYRMYTKKRNIKYLNNHHLWEPLLGLRNRSVQIEIVHTTEFTEGGGAGTRMRVSGCSRVPPRRSSRISVDCMQIAVAATWAPPHSSRTTGKGSSTFLPWQKPAVSLNKTSREEFQPEKRERRKKRKKEREREMALLVASLHRVVKYTSHQLILIKMRLTLTARSLVSFRFEP